MNKTILIGEISNKFITTTRISGLTDTIPIETDKNGYFRVEGQLHTFNTPDRHLKMYVQPETISETDDPSDNTIELTGYICRSPIFRLTPNGREICDFLLSVSRINRQSDYIPCIAWGTNARRISELKIGTELNVTGRIQSREYLKNGETKTTYEVSVG